MKKYITTAQFLKHLSKFKNIEDESGKIINEIPELPCYVYCGEYGIAECENGKSDLGLEELVAQSWILESDLIELISLENKNLK